jgi:hypothetical protein
MEVFNKLLEISIKKKNPDDNPNIKETLKKMRKLFYSIKK